MRGGSGDGPAGLIERRVAEGTADPSLRRSRLRVTASAGMTMPGDQAFVVPPTFGFALYCSAVLQAEARGGCCISWPLLRSGRASNMSMSGGVG
jgi:hypothetical protein